MTRREALRRRRAAIRVRGGARGTGYTGATGQISEMQWILGGGGHDHGEALSRRREAVRVRVG